MVHVMERLTKRRHLVLTPSLDRAIQDWRYENHIESWGEAVRLLIEKGLATQPKGKAKPQ